MFPSFIGILDIQSWWEVPSIAHFCSLFRAAFNLLDFDIEELEEALLTDGTEESASSLLTELIVRLLCGCLGNKDISAFNYQMFLRRLFRQKCQETNRYNPFNTDIDFQFLPLRTKVEILYALCDFRLDADDVFDLFKNLEAESLRVEPLGWDNKSSAYWYFYGTRLYREDYKEKPKGKKQKKKEDKRKKKHGNLVEEEDDTERVWQVVCFTESDWTHLTEKLKNATSKVEKDLYHALSENFLPEIPRLFKDKERLQRKRLLESVPRRTSSRVQTKNKQKEDDIPKPMEDLPKTRENTPSEREERARHRNLSRAPSESSESRASSSSLRRAPGRQTNNSLACATGRILIPEGGPPGRKKLKTSQIFAHSEEDIQTDMYKVLEQLKAHEDAWPFMDPVEEDYAPNYYSVIRRPMDLQRMEERLDQGYYTDFNSFKADFNLIVNNCRLYNGHDNEYTGMVGNLEIAFDRLTQRYFEGPTSTDDEIAVEYPPQNPSPRKHKTEHLESKKKKRKLVTDESANSDDDIKSDGRRLSADRITPEKRRKTDKKQKKHESTLPDDVEYFSDHSVTIETDKDKISQHKHDKKHKKMKNQKSSRKSRKEKHALKKSKLKKKQQKYEEKIKRKKDRMSSLDSMMSENFDPKTKLPSKIREVTPEIDFFKDKFDKIKERRRGSSKNLNLETITEKVSTKAKINLSIPEKDKNLNLKETIEKLKAKSKKNDENSVLFDDMFQSNPKPLKKHKMECSELASKQDRHLKPKTTDEYEFVDDLDDLDGDQNKSSKVKNDKVKKITKKQAITKNESATEALEQAVKDISKWLDDTEFNSNSTSPLQVSTADDFMSIAPKIDEEADLQDKDKWANLKKDSNIKKRLTQKDAGKVVSKRKEIQRTIERLQPGKSKGNLITNIPTNSKPEEVTPSALAISKAKEVKNSLIVKTDEGSPKLSLGTVLPSEGFGLGKQHNFTNEINSTTASKVKVVDTGTMTSENEDSKEDKSAVKTLDPVETPKPEVGPTKISLSQCQEKATPNLSAWFKAFGAPKSGTSKKKVDDIDQDDSKSNDNETKNTSPPDSSKTEQVPVEEALTPDGGESPMATTVAGSRPRRTSTGSSISERSSFSQDLDSPRHQPSHPSPLLRSPASPRIEDHQKNYPLMNGSVRVGFYQDTTSVKSSPEKSCSPREAPQSPYAAYSQHVYAAASAAANSANISSQYSADGPNKSPLPTYGQTQPPAYYDTSKVNQSSKPAHGQDDYTAYGPDMGYQQPTSPFAGPFSPAQSPYSHHSQHSPYSHPQHSPQTFNVVQNPTGNNPLHIAERQQDKTAVFPVKKRTYNEPKLAVSEASMASPVAAPTNPIYSLGQTYKDSLDKPGSSQNPSMPFYEPDKSAPITSSNVMQSNPPSVIMSTDPNSAHKFGMYSGPKTTNVEEVSVISMATTSSLMTESNTQNMATRNQYQSIITPDYGARKSQYDFHLGLNKNYEEESENSTLSQDVNKHPYASIKNSGIVPRPDIISRSSPMDMVNMGYGKSMDNLKGKSNVDMVNMGYLLPDPNKMDKLGRLNPGKIDPNHAKSVSRGFDLYNSMPTNLAYMGRLDSNVNQGMAKMSSTPDPNDVRYNSMLHYQHPQFDNNKSLSSELPESLITRNESTIKQTVGPMVKDNTKKTPTATNYTDWKMDASKANISSHKTSIMETKSPSVEANQTVKSSNESQLTYEQIPTSKQTEEAEQMPPDYRSTNRRAVIERSSSKYKPDSQPTSQADFNSHLRNVNLNMGMHSDRTYSHNVSMNPVSTACKPPPPYSHSPHPMDQSMRALTGLPHIMERFTKDDKTINFPSSSPSFHDKSLSLYAKSLHGTATSSPMYPTTSMPMTYSKEAMYSNVQPAHSTQQELQDNRQTEHEAKPKSRKKKSNTETAASSAASQFHSYPSLKTTQTSAAEQSAISLKSANIVPGSAFNFGPSAGVGLYSDSSSFLELRNSPVNQFTANMAANFMVAAAAAHQRSTPDPNDKTKPAHQPPASPYQFLNHPQVRPGYPFMDPAAPLYQQYIQQQELLRHSGSQMMGIFSPSFPGPLGTRQTFDSRPPWM